MGVNGSIQFQNRLKFSINYNVHGAPLERVKNVTNFYQQYLQWVRQLLQSKCLYGGQPPTRALKKLPWLLYHESNLLITLPFRLPLSAVNGASALV